MTKKTIEQTYQVLDEISHVRKRCGMYAGSTSVETQDAYIYNPELKRMESRKISIAPALIKIYSEILDNAIDESRRADGMTAIKVTVSDDGTISILDDGRGIPVVIHEDTQKYIAETVFSNLRAGSNFNDEEDQDLIGTNGVGSTLTNILSTSFKIESADGKKQFTQTFRQGMRERGEPKITESTKHFTRITFTPDWEFFKLAGLDEDHKLRMYKKVVDAAATNPQVKFFLNGEQIKVKNFSDYIALHDESFVYDDGADFKVGVTKFDRLQQISFINSVETYQGGSHVTYITNQIVEALRAVIKKKHKVDVSPGDIRSHMCVFISGRVNRPRFSSQTKENMISPVSEWKTSWTVSDKFIQKLLKTEIIQSILDWAAAKEQAQLNKELRNANKSIDKVDPRRVAKFSDAIERINRHRCVLFLAEGDSASKSLVGARGNNPYYGSYPLKGKPLNVRGKTTHAVLGLDKEKAKAATGKKPEPNELQKIMTILGLQIGVPVTMIDAPEGEWVEVQIDGQGYIVNENDCIYLDGVVQQVYGMEYSKRDIKMNAGSLAQYRNLPGVKRIQVPNLRFGKLAMAADADVDGFHICGLLLNLFEQYWPELFDMDFIHILRTPVIMVTLKDKSTLEFFTEVDYREWEANDGAALRGWSMKYYKGLSSWNTPQFANFLKNLDEYLFAVTMDDTKDSDALDLAFNDTRADDRKEWLESPAGDFNAFVVVESM